MLLPKRRGVRIAAAVAVCSSLAAIGAVAAEEDMDARLPFGVSPGDRVTMSVTVGSDCKPGTPEVGFSKVPWEEFLHQTGSDDPRTGDELVLLRPKQAPGTKFDVDIVVPDPGTDEPTLYAYCQANPPNEGWIGAYGPYRFGEGASGSPSQSASASPSPTSDNRPPVAADDSYAVAAGKTLEIAAPGVLSNDSDPDGDSIVAVLKSRASTTDATARFRPNGALEANANRPGLLCIEYVARDSKGAVSAPATVVVSVGGADPKDAANKECAALTEKGPFEFTVTEGEGSLTDEMIEAKASTGGTSAMRGMLFAPAGALAAGIPVPRGADCSLWSCLYGFFHPPYYQCNQNIFTLSFGRSRYGSMTAYGYIRKGNADYAKVRGLYYQDGVLVHTTGWETKYFNGTTYTAWNSVRLHQQFPSPQSVYRVGFQAQWYQAISWGRDRQIAATNGAAPVPIECVAGP